MNGGRISEGTGLFNAAEDRGKVAFFVRLQQVGWKAAGGVCCCAGGGGSGDGGNDIIHD